MPLFTTYLARRNLLVDSPRQLRSVFSDTLPIEFVYVARKRGNRAVEPPEMVLRLAKEGAITWEGYKDAYLDSLNTCDSRMWMQIVATRCAEKNIVLVCYEKAKGKRCHRFLLAERMAQDYGVEYKGELVVRCTYHNCCVNHPFDCPPDGEHGDVTEDYSCLLMPPEFEEASS